MWSCSTNYRNATPPSLRFWLLRGLTPETSGPDYCTIKRDGTPGCLKYPGSEEIVQECIKLTSIGAAKATYSWNRLPLRNFRHAEAANAALSNDIGSEMWRS